MKASYGQFWLYPGADFASSINPNASTWYRQYRWTTDLNRNGVWDPARRGRAAAVSVAAPCRRRSIRHCRTHTPDQATAYFEREVARKLRRSHRIRLERTPSGPRHRQRLTGRSTPTTFRSRSEIPGPDGRAGTGRRWRHVHRLQPGGRKRSPAAREHHDEPARCQQRLLHLGNDRDATRDAADGRCWPVSPKPGASETNLAGGASYTPNALINTDDGLQQSTRRGRERSMRPSGCQASCAVTPVYRHQSGTPFGRTFVTAA